MRTLTQLLLATCLSTLALTSQASPSQMGTDFRTMESNYTMFDDIKNRCPDLQLPDIEPRMKVERMMQQKLGIKLYIQLMMRIGKSDLKKNAKATVAKLWQQIEGCEDPKLEAATGRIAKVHGEAFKRLDQEPAIAKARKVPIPLRR